MIHIQGEKMIAHIILGILLLLEGLSTKEKCWNKLLYVEDITQNSAMLYWKDIGSNDVKDYKVLCAGVRQYISVDGIVEIDLDAITQFVPHGVGHAFLSQLQSNFNYSCVVQSEPVTEVLTRPVLFSTSYSVPEVPNRPEISYSMGGRQIDILLFPTSTKYGPIDGYEVQFHIIDDETTHVHGQPDFPHELTQPKGLLSNLDTAQSSRYPLPFCIAYRNSSLPSHITISDNLLQGAIHSDTTYAVIMAAYTDNYEELSRPVLYSLSQSSQPFTLYITSSGVQSENTMSWLEIYLLKWSMAIGLITSNIILVYFIVIGSCILYVDNKRHSSENECILQKDRGMLAITSGKKDKTSPIVKKGPPSQNSHVELSDSGAATAISSVNNETSYLEQVSLTSSMSVKILPSIEPFERKNDTQSSTPCDESIHTTLQLEEPNSIASQCSSSHKTDDLSLKDDDGDCMKLCEEISSKPCESEKVTMQATTQMIISEILKKAQQSTEIIETSSHNEEWLSSSASHHNDKPTQVNEPHQSLATTTNDDDTMQSCSSSLVFIPRGLSQGPLSITNTTSELPSCTDLAPDLEMDLYGISYSLDDQ